MKRSAVSARATPRRSGSARRHARASCRSSVRRAADPELSTRPADHAVEYRAGDGHRPLRARGEDEHGRGRPQWADSMHDIDLLGAGDDDRQLAGGGPVVVRAATGPRAAERKRWKRQRLSQRRAARAGTDGRPEGGDCGRARKMGQVNKPSLRRRKARLVTASSPEIVSSDRVWRRSATGTFGWSRLMSLKVTRSSRCRRNPGRRVRGRSTP